MTTNAGPPSSHYAGNSKKVVLRKSKIQITKYKIQEKVFTYMSHHTHEWAFNYQSVLIHCTRRYFLLSGILPREMFTFEAHHKGF